ncbi:hypothetical protein EC968_009664 [Mortierella alpina]|nr:hypothetical protein EC968_009664 [Mortierella alpina]
MVNLSVLKQLPREMGRPPLETYPLFILGGMVHTAGVAMAVHKLRADPDLRVHHYQRMAPSYPSEVLYIQPPSPRHAQLARPVHAHPHTPAEALPDRAEYALSLSAQTPAAL